MGPLTHSQSLKVRVFWDCFCFEDDHGSVFVAAEVD